MKAIGWTAILLCGVLSACSASGQAPERKKLHQGEMIQGYPCVKGYAWFYVTQKLKSCTVAVEIPFGTVTIPAGSVITLTPDGKPAIVQMSHDTVLNGLHAQGGSLLGASEGPMVVFYADGKLRELFLSEDQSVDGVPCARSSIKMSALRKDTSVQLDQEGHLRACMLADNYGSKKKGERILK